MILTDEEREAALHPLGVARYSTLMSPADVHRIARAIESAVLRKLREAGPVAWQWRRSWQGWSLERTFSSKVYATTEDSEVRALFTIPEEQP